MKRKPRRLLFLTALYAFAMIVGMMSPGEASAKPGRVFILMVWDGLRPDSLTRQETPNLLALAHEGVLLADHHSVFPTITMVDAASLATGGMPAETGIFGDLVYFAPQLDAKPAASLPAVGGLLDKPLNIENSAYLAELNGPNAFNGHLLGVAGVARQIEQAGGYVALVGKQGPTFLFDDREADSTANPNKFLFVADDVSNPPQVANDAAAKPPIDRGNPDSVGARDRWLLQFVLDKALPGAKAASARGRPSLIVFWQHNPDLVQHIAGLGTQPALNALRQCDANLGRINTAVAKLGLRRMTDLMVVSDHGFATIRMSVSLGDLLVAAGIKRSKASDDIVVARNGGEDLVYLSGKAFPSVEQRRAMLARIVDFAEAQEWCGAIFSRKPAPPDVKNQQNHPGWIPGTFAQQAFGLYDDKRSPDLIISFRELPNLDNSTLTGPDKPAFALDLHGQVSEKNMSAPLVQPVAGAVYSDAPSFSTGMGMHAAAGQRELHNFCAVAGPDFRRHFTDHDPTGNADIAPTIRQIFAQTSPVESRGRPLDEILARRVRSSLAPRQLTMTSYLVLQGQEVVTTLYLTQFDGIQYLDDSSVGRQSLGGSP
jgi:hypothetical protein